MTERAQGVVVLGATSMIARAVARQLAERGHAIVVAARDREENEAIARDLRVRYGVDAAALEWDAANFEEDEGFVNACIEALNDSIDGVVLCSGFMEEQERAYNEFAVARRTIDVNLTGSISVLNRFAHYFESKGAGWMAVVSSVAGDRGRQSNYIYGASKAGLSAYCEGLRNHLYHHGVHVMTVKPGFVDTKMTWGQVPFAAAPDAVAADILRGIAKGKNTIYAPFFWRYIMLLIRHIPEWQFKKMKM